MRAGEPNCARHQWLPCVPCPLRAMAGAAARATVLSRRPGAPGSPPCVLLPRRQSLSALKEGIAKLPIPCATDSCGEGQRSTVGSAYGSADPTVDLWPSPQLSVAHGMG